MNPWPAPSVPKPDTNKLAAADRRAAATQGRSYRKAGRPKANRATARHAVRATRETGSQAQRSAPGEGAGPPGLRLLAESPAVGASWNKGITRANSAQENITQAATDRLPNDKKHALTCRPSRGRPRPAQGSSPAWAETRRAPPGVRSREARARAVEPGPKEAAYISKNVFRSSPELQPAAWHSMLRGCKIDCSTQPRNRRRRCGQPLSIRHFFTYLPHRTAGTRSAITSHS